jgi:hypothetical protein
LVRRGDAESPFGGGRELNGRGIDDQAGTSELQQEPHPIDPR